MARHDGAWAGVAYGSTTVLLLAAIPVFILGMLGAALSESENPPAYLLLAFAAATVMAGGYGWGLSLLGGSPKTAIVAFLVPPPVLLLIGHEFSSGWDVYSLALPTVGLVPPLATWRSLQTSPRGGCGSPLEFEGRTRVLAAASAQAVIAVLTLAGWWADGLREPGVIAFYPLVAIAGLGLLWRERTALWGGRLLVALSVGVAVDLALRHGLDSATNLILLWACFGGLGLIAGLLTLRNLS